jgi:Mn-dependent DtxR family transcriptional regulator
LNSIDIMTDEEHNELTKALEDYLKVIYIIEEEYGSAAVSDIANEMGVKNPSVTFALQRLDKHSLVNYRRYRNVTLTEEGKRIAESLCYVYNTLRDFFLLMNVEKSIANADACRIEHVAHAQTIQRISQFLEFIKEPKIKASFDKFKEFIT